MPVTGSKHPGGHLPRKAEERQVCDALDEPIHPPPEPPLLWFAANRPPGIRSMSSTAPQRAAPSTSTRAAPTVDGARDAHLAGLLAACSRGDCTAFEAFYDATFSYAQVVARRMLSGQDVEDLLSEAYFEAWRSVARFDAARGSAVTWLLTIVRSRCLDLLRHHRVHPSVGGSGDEPPSTDNAPSEEADPIERLWRQQTDRHLTDALRALSAAERWVLGLAYFRELSHSQIALATGMPLGTVKTLILRAQQRLRELLAPLAGTPIPSTPKIRS